MRSKVFFIVMALALASLMGGVPVAHTAQLYLESTDTYVKAGDTFQLMVKVVDATDVAGAALTIEYDSEVFEVDETDQGGYFIPQEAGMFPTVYDTRQPPGTPDQADPRMGNDEPALGQVLLSGAYVDTGNGGGHYSGIQTLFSIRFKVKDGASLGSYDIDLKQTELLNIDAGWGIDTNSDGIKDAPEPVPVLVGAVPDTDTDNWDNLSGGAFFVLLGDNNHPFSEVTGTVHVSPWSPVDLPNEMFVHGSASGDWIGAFGPGGDCRGVSRISGGSYNLTIAGDADGEEITFKIFRNGGEVVCPQTVDFDDGATEEIDFGCTRDMELSTGWNLVSLPVVPDDPSLSAIFPDAEVAYKFDGSYQSVTTLEPGVGYWVKVPDNGIYSITGQCFTCYTVTLSAGWHLIGAVDCTSTPETDPAGCIEVMYGFSGSYYEANELESGKGYWVKVNQECDFTLCCQ